MLKCPRALASAILAALMAATATPVWSETLREALILAYRTNPTLLAQRASLRALDESIVQARAGLRPTIDVNGRIDYSRRDSPGTAPVGGLTESESGGVSIGLSQTLYSGGRISHGITAAEADIRAGRENLRDIEQQVLVSVIQAYAEVLRDTEILRIRLDNITVLQRQLEESAARFEVGEITRTDVAQSEARLAQSQADLANAQAQLSVSRAAYAAVVGQAPADLAPLPDLPVPAQFESALDAALMENPGVGAAGYSLRAAEARVAAARAEYRPSARLIGSYGASSNDLSAFDLAERTALEIGVSISVPLFTGGLNRSRVAQALERANVAQINVEAERRRVLQIVSSSYARVISAQLTLEAGEEAVRAASIAAEGVREEARVGLRTTLDVLNQELELRSAEVTTANARRNEHIARAELLAAMGRLGAADLDPSLETYDPEANYSRVRQRGALPWDGIVETLDRIAAPPIEPANDAADAPVDHQLEMGVDRLSRR